MQKQQIVYNSPVDAIVAIAKHLNRYEERHQLTSETFFDKFNKGQLDDTSEFVEWANDYQHFLALKLELEERLTHAA